MNVNELLTAVILLLLIVQLALLYRMKRAQVSNAELGDLIQGAINDVADKISESFIETLSNPNVKRAMTILGKESGAARADSATIDKFNENIGALNPTLAFLADQLDMEPTQILSLANHPSIKPYIEGFLTPGQPEGQQRTIPPA